MSGFTVGEVVVCVDAADIPTPPWHPLEAGKTYCIRAIDFIPEIDGNYDKNIHKKAKYLLRLWGVSNPVNPAFGKELGYAESRFEHIENDNVNVVVEETVDQAA